jgi:hypothetical protein
MLYDNSCPGLTQAWWGGGRLYRRLHRIDHFAGFDNWTSALEWLARVEPQRAIDEIQVWCHGKWGRVLLGRDRLDVRALDESRKQLSAVRERLSGQQALWWFRTCETFGARAGHDFARRWTDFFGCAAAGHSYAIGAWQSGLHRLMPGAAPSWSPREGLRQGTPEAPERAWASHPFAPNTISCLQGSVPREF